MKRIVLALFVFTITMSSICWAADLDPTELTGTWELDRGEVFSPNASREEL